MTTRKFEHTKRPEQLQAVLFAEHGVRASSRLKLVLTATLLAGMSLGGCAAEGDPDDPELIAIESRSSRVPIIFVHGCTPPDATDDVAVLLWEPMAQYFLSQGYPENYLVRFLNRSAQCTSNVSFAIQLAVLVARVKAQTHSSRVDIIAHSMGSLAIRLYIRFGGAHNIRNFVGIAGANHGTDGGIFRPEALKWQDMFGGYPWFEGVHEMVPPYACRGQTYQHSADIQFIVNGCLTPTGRSVFTDETPGNINYLSIRNTEDEVVVPVESACLNQRFQNDCSDTNVNAAVTVPAGECFYDPSSFCPAHVTALWDPGVVNMTYDFVSP